MSCDCDGSDDVVTALEQSRLTREDLTAYQRDELTILDLTVEADADLDPASINDFGTLAVELVWAPDVDT